MDDPELHRLAYEREILAVLPRVLALFDTDPISATNGFADRLYWSWKLIDYPNATPQGLVHGLALLVAHQRLPWNIDPAAIIERIDAAIAATGRQRAADGSLVEAFPNEKSFCVTALLAYDILCAADALKPHVSPDRLARWHEVVAPMIAFLIRFDETHAIISNHLATAAAALFRWAERGDAAAGRRAQQILDIILEHQSAEGWFLEYDGADPGYETLGLGYLSDINQRQSLPALRTALDRAVTFLGYAAHPDGSFGGIYGSRNTRFIYPAGLEILAAQSPAAAALAAFARDSIEARRVPVLSTMDDPNLAPMFNAYCRALIAAADNRSVAAEPLPCRSQTSWRKSFPATGLLVDNGPLHYTIVSTLKGGVVYHFGKRPDIASVIDTGVAVEVSGRIYTTQAISKDNCVDFGTDRLIIESQFAAATSEQQTPAKMIVLRLLALTVFRSRTLLEIVKRMLVRRLITGRKTIALRNRRSIIWGPALSIVDRQIGDAQARRRDDATRFRAIHMASSGYWQIGDDAR